ncbi:MAG TPA: AbrB/MazE/SpoVT family DNA-binding domain-containing protein [Noviherbaspirillum sp.]|nr:AbrB/MazE/SpoVT family DNA-binding domain-containing protein [Noviherbaspirillum sp.]
MYKLKLTQIGDAVGIVLPPRALALLKRRGGETVYVSEIEEGLLMLSAYDPALQDQIEAGREFLQDYGATLQALAK